MDRNLVVWCVAAFPIIGISKQCFGSPTSLPMMFTNGGTFGLCYQQDQGRRGGAKSAVWNFSSHLSVSYAIFIRRIFDRGRLPLEQQVNFVTGHPECSNLVHLKDILSRGEDREEATGKPLRHGLARGNLQREGPDQRLPTRENCLLVNR